MPRQLLAAAAGVVAASAGALAIPSTAGAAPAQRAHAERVCPAVPSAGHATCFAQRLVDEAGRAVTPNGVAVSPQAVSGLSPSSVQSAYRLSGLSTTRTVAIVDAYGYPNAARDLATYRSKWGLPACTKANGCLKIVSQTGTSTLPAFNLGWAQEQALDLDAVSAACPSCRILLVQAKSASFANLGKAVNTAAKTAGVVAISNSYGGADLADSAYGSPYNHPGIAVTASSGDSGYAGAMFPASSQYVTAVGGTTLTTSTNARGWTETAWNGAGSGCTTLNIAPTGQSSAVTHCSGRAIADVAAVADPRTGLAVYAPTSKKASSWAQFGGTSLSSPIVASVYALSGNTSGYANTIPYASPTGLFDVTSGRNGSCASWCLATTGWDGPTGLGTPNGTSAF